MHSVSSNQNGLTGPTLAYLYGRQSDVHAHSLPRGV